MTAPPRPPPAGSARSCASCIPGLRPAGGTGWRWGTGSSPARDREGREMKERAPAGGLEDGSRARIGDSCVSAAGGVEGSAEAELTGGATAGDGGHEALRGPPPSLSTDLEFSLGGGVRPPPSRSRTRWQRPSRARPTDAIRWGPQNLLPHPAPPRNSPVHSDLHHLVSGTQLRAEGGEH